MSTYSGEGVRWQHAEITAHIPLPQQFSGCSYVVRVSGQAEPPPHRGAPVARLTSRGAIRCSNRSSREHLAACAVAAVVTRGLKPVGVGIPRIAFVKRQTLLAVVGFAFMTMGEVWGGLG